MITLSRHPIPVGCQGLFVRSGYAPNLHYSRQVLRTSLALFVGLLFAAPIASGAGWLEMTSPELRKASEELAMSRSELAALGEPMIGNTVPEIGYQLEQLQFPPPTSPWVQVDLGSSQPLDTIALIPAMIESQPGAQGAYGFPLRFRVDISDDATFNRFEPLLVETADDFPSPGMAPVVIPAHGHSARYVRVTVTRLNQVNGRFFFALAELMALRGNRNVALGAPVTASNSITVANRWAASYLTDGRTPLGPPIKKAPLARFDGLVAIPSSPGTEPWMEVDLGSARHLDEVRLHPMHSWFSADAPGYAFPTKFRVEVASNEDFSDAQLIFDTKDKDFPNPGNNPVTLRADGRTGRFVRVTGEVAGTPAPPRFALSELEVQADGAMASRGCRVLISAQPSRTADRLLSLLTDGSTSYGELIELPLWLAQSARRSQLREQVNGLEHRIARLRGEAIMRVAWIGLIAAVVLVSTSIILVAKGRRARRLEQRAFRQRLAQDMHDEIGSNLAGIAILAETGALNLPGATGELDEIKRVAQETADAMREVLWLVGSTRENGIELTQQLRKVAARLLPRSDVVWTAMPDQFPSSWPIALRRELLLFFKEAVTNISRHAQATRVEISVTIDRGWLELSLRDNGRGFNTALPSKGLGLKGLKARAVALAGSVTITSQPGQGTTVILQAKLDSKPS